MRRAFLSVLLLAVLTAMIAPAAMASDSRREVSLWGVIARVGDNAIVLRSDRGLVTINVVERTQITINGREADLSDLRTGDLARVQAVVVQNDRGRHLIARIIAASRRG